MRLRPSLPGYVRARSRCAPLRTLSHRSKAPRVLALPLLSWVLSASSMRADVVVPSERVREHVNLREQPTASSRLMGLLHVGEQLHYLGSVPGWYQVELPSGVPVFVSKAWTILAPEAPAAAEAVPEFTLDAVDVGTGLAIVVRGPDFCLVYDGGSNDDLARGDHNRLLAYLKKEVPDLQRIEHLILSHPHRDHVELLPDLFSHYNIADVWDSGAVNPICSYRALLKAISIEPGAHYHDALHEFGDVSVPFDAQVCYGVSQPAEAIVLPSAGTIGEDPIPLGTTASMVFLHADGGKHASFNENSLVVRLDLAGTRVLLMGDAEAGGRKAPSALPSADSTEGTLLTCCRDALRADVLVVGHHGSKTSSRTAFLDAVGAHTFIVSAGPKKYATVILPDQEVIDELITRGAVFRTDRDDADCASQPAKLGPDADGRAGGCDNIRVLIRGGTVAPAYFTILD